jgi:hypothetical protein
MMGRKITCTAHRAADLLIAEVDGGAAVSLLRVSAFGLRTQPAFGPVLGREPSLRSLPSRQGRQGRARIAKAPEVFHRLETSCGERPAPDGATHGWKAPRVQRIAVLFAEDRVRRPLAPDGVRASDPSVPEKAA